MDRPAPPITMDVLCLGAAALRLQVTQGAVPEITGDMAKVAVAAARAGARSALASRVGADALGDLLRSRLTAAGVRTDLIGEDAQAYTAHSVGIGGALGQVDHFTGSALAHLSPAHVDPLPLDQCHVLHLSVRTAMLGAEAGAAIEAACGRVRRAGGRISVDLAVDDLPASADGVARDLARWADIAFVTPATCGRLVGTQHSEAGVQRVQRLGPALTFLDMGQDGIVVETADGPLRIDPVTSEPVDARGAAAAFTGYVLSSLTAGDDLVTAATLGHSAAMITAGRHGGAETIPALDDLLSMGHSDPGPKAAAPDAKSHAATARAN